MFAKKPKTVEGILSSFLTMKTDLEQIVLEQTSTETQLQDQISALEALQKSAVIERLRAITAIENIEKLLP